MSIVFQVSDCVMVNIFLISNKFGRFHKLRGSVTALSALSPLQDLSFDTSAIDAWSVSGTSLNSSDLASTFFAISLFPYLAMLSFLFKKESNIPKLSLGGFCFLLVFVFATIPAGIYAKMEYHDILANEDLLHGLSESLLTITNLLIIFGFRNALRPAGSNETTSPTTTVGVIIALSAIALQLTAPEFVPSLISNNLPPSVLDTLSPLYHAEPSNALSLPTWMVHTSSILEWLTAMRLIWLYADASGNPRWKGMAIAMIPSNVRCL